MFLVLYCNCLCPIHWSQVLSGLWRCRWGSADRHCSVYIWVINNFIAYWGAAYIRVLTVYTMAFRVNHSMSGGRKFNIKLFILKDIPLVMIWIHNHKPHVVKNISGIMTCWFYHTWFILNIHTKWYIIANVSSSLSTTLICIKMITTDIMYCHFTNHTSPNNATSYSHRLKHLLYSTHIYMDRYWNGRIW